MKKIISNKFLVPFILLFMFFVMISSSSGDSATNDEIPHIIAGYSYVTTADYRLNPEHPPLIKDAAGLMLFFMNPRPSLPEDHYERPMNDQWVEGRWFLYESGNDADLMVFLARIPIMLLALILGYFVYRWSSEIHGKKAGLFALTLYAFDANIIAHSRIVTTDLGAMATIFINLYFLWLFLREPSKKRLLWVSLTLAIALLTKFSAPILVVSYALIGIYLTFRPIKYEKGSLIFTRFFNSGFIRRFIGYFLSFFVAGIIALLIVWAVYALHTFNMPPEVYHQSIDAELYPGPIKDILHWIAEVPVLRSLGHYFLGFFMVSQHATSGHISYLLGEVSNGWWYYYIIAFLVKVPIPVIALLFGSFLFFRSEKHKDNRDKAILLIPIIVLWVLALSTKLNLGIRYLLPMFPLAYVFISFLAEKVYLKDVKDFFAKKINFQTTFSIILFLLIFWHIGSSIKTYPHYLTYFNEAIGGPKNGMRYITDSNLDWGQDLKRLTSYVNEKKINKIRVHYFGHADPLYYLGPKYIKWDVDKTPEPGYYALSVTLFQEKRARGEYEWLADEKPLTTIGHSILIFKYQI